ncbi:ABC transporter permease [Lacticaseibacillus saniviri]|uniref:ABC transporter permease n=1 Tax=Lacticaseibacillus saniviri JCM 17471 = DSM 24301 TaxID=1293598 RepID=A0A0R2MPM8_9LACO|nr:ABC transporter permease [Lacticaseibacillus saniviri]KRO15608.1 ABC transporter permease [Lacticaseibacillus saniviri JCM 17471 = DSM 24301]MCG4282521.1 ABC transporter permease [Lacticaseibacillus saniviri]
MRATAVFIQKEWLETWRTRRVLILLIVFLIFGILSPLFAKLTPELLKATLGNQMAITLPKPTSVDSWTQFYKNITQMGIYIVAILFGGTVSQELAHGTLVNLVTKGLPRYAVVLAKFVVAYLQWVLAILLAFAVTFGYTWYYFPDNHSPHLWQGIVPVLIFGFFFIAVIVCGSSLSANSYSGLLATIIVVAALYLINFWKDAQRFNPISLISDNVTLTKGSETLQHLAPALWLSVGGAVMLLGLSVWLLNQRKL